MSAKDNVMESDDRAALELPRVPGKEEYELAPSLNSIVAAPEPKSTITIGHHQCHESR